MMLVYIMLES